MVRTDGLKALAGKRAVKAGPPWTPPTMADFREGFVLAFDPSLSATGFVWLARFDAGAGPRMEVRAGEVHGTTAPEGVKGKLAEVMRGQRLYWSLHGLLTAYRPIRDEIEVVHEAPPTGGGVVRSPESALLASLALRIAAEDLGFTLAPPVAVATHRKLVCGRVKGVDKKEEHRVLRTWAPDLIDGFAEHVTNEAKRDALCVGLAHLAR